jgi:hypothetical protein
VKYWTVHLKPQNPALPNAPVLVREGFSFAAFLFGPIWLLAHRAWIPAVLLIAVNVVVGSLAPEAAEPLLFLGIMLFVGVTGNDMRRFSLERAGYLLMHVVAARDVDGALARLLDRRPELTGSLAEGLSA